MGWGMGRRVKLATAALALMGLGGCGQTVKSETRLRVPLADNPAGAEVAERCVAKCEQRGAGDAYRLAMCLRGCPGVEESPGACHETPQDRPPVARCHVWVAEGWKSNLPSDGSETDGSRAAGLGWFLLLGSENSSSSKSSGKSGSASPSRVPASPSPSRDRTPATPTRGPRR